MSNGVIVHSNQLSRAGLNKQVLKNGSSVLVRVIADKGNGQYTGSVAGVRVNLKSNQNLRIGSTFVAVISQKDGTIFISPKENYVSAENFKLEILSNNQISYILQNLGVPLDKISVNLFKQFKQLEMKLDAALLNKLHNLSVKFKGREKLASELLTILTEKEIQVDDDAILQLLELLENNHDYNENGYRQGRKLLSEINRKSGSWFIFPFELIEIEKSDVLGKGSLRLLVDKNDDLKILNIDCKISDKRFLFNLNFERKHIKKIRFNIEEKISSGLIPLLKNKFPYAEIEWAEIDDIEGTASNSEEFYSYEGVV